MAIYNEAWNRDYKLGSREERLMLQEIAMTKHGLFGRHGRLSRQYVSTTTTSLTFLLRQTSSVKCHDIVNNLAKGGVSL